MPVESISKSEGPFEPIACHTAENYRICAYVLGVIQRDELSVAELEEDDTDNHNETGRNPELHPALVSRWILRVDAASRAPKFPGCVASFTPGLPFSIQAQSAPVHRSDICSPETDIKSSEATPIFFRNKGSIDVSRSSFDLQLPAMEQPTITGASMNPSRTWLAAAMLVLLVSACSDAPTSPIQAIQATPASLISISVTPDPTLVTFNSASCTLTNANVGNVSCSWNISNPAANSLNLWAQTILTVTYDCVNPHNGRIASSETRDLETLIQFFGQTSTTLTGTNVALPPPFLPNDFKGKEHTQNACKGNGVPTGIHYSLTYWDVSVITTSGTQRFSCFASDNRLGCFT
jgi:hypothetical protein